MEHDLKTVVDFLNHLNANNHKEWFEKNKSMYQKAKSTFETFVEQLIASVGGFDSEILTLTPKDCTFRINRDVRFSKNKEPYKNNFGASLKAGGRKSEKCGYYFHIEAGENSFLGGGFYMPSAEVLAKIRQEIDYQYDSFKKIVENETFKQYFQNISGEKLKNQPKGYQKDNPAIEFLKFKSFVVMHPVPNEILFSEDILTHTQDVFKAMKPFIDFLNQGIE